MQGYVSEVVLDNAVRDLRKPGVCLALCADQASNSGHCTTGDLNSQFPIADNLIRVFRSWTTVIRPGSPSARVDDKKEKHLAEVIYIT